MDVTFLKWSCYGSIQSARHDMNATRHGMESEHLFNPSIYLIWVFEKVVFRISREKYFCAFTWIQGLYNDICVW